MTYFICIVLYIFYKLRILSNDFEFEWHKTPSCEVVNPEFTDNHIGNLATFVNYKAMM